MLTTSKISKYYNDESCCLLLHSDTFDGDSAIRDYSLNNLPVTVNGNVFNRNTYGFDCGGSGIHFHTVGDTIDVENINTGYGDWFLWCYTRVLLVNNSNYQSLIEFFTDDRKFICTVKVRHYYIYVRLYLNDNLIKNGYVELSYNSTTPQAFHFEFRYYNGKLYAYVNNSETWNYNIKLPSMTHLRFGNWEYNDRDIYLHQLIINKKDTLNSHTNCITNI